MKKWLIVVAMCLLFASASFAQDNVAFVGARYDKGLIFSTGYGTNVFGKLWSFTYGDFGNYQVVNTEVAYIMTLPIFNNKLHIGPIAGPNVDWLGSSEQDGLPPTTYIVGASGVIGCYDISNKVGAWGFAKYKFSFDDDNLYKDGYVGGGGLYYRF